MDDARVNPSPLPTLSPVPDLPLNFFLLDSPNQIRKLMFAMYPFRNILFPTDFTPHARAALKYAAAFARSGGGRAVLFSVQSASVPANLLTLPERIFTEQDNRWLLQLRTEVRALLADPLFNGLEVEPVIVEGEPATEIAKAVRDYDIDLVTVVTHGRKGLSRALWGSTAEEIIAEAPCPVLTIRPPQHDFVEHKGDRSEVRLNRILLATNFRPSAAAATQVATQLANQTGAELHAVSVIGDYLEQISVMFPEGGLNALTSLRSYVKERMNQLTRGMELVRCVTSSKADPTLRLCAWPRRLMST